MNSEHYLRRPKLLWSTRWQITLFVKNPTWMGSTTERRRKWKSEIDKWKKWNWQVKVKRENEKWKLNGKVEVKWKSVEHWHLGPFNPFAEVLLLLMGKGRLNEDLLELLVGVVDDELLKAVLLESLKPVEVQDPKGFVLPMGFYLIMEISEMATREIWGMLSDVTFARIHAFAFCGRLALNRKCFLPRRDLDAVLHQFFY